MLKLDSVIPIKYVKIPLSYPDTIPPKFKVDINKAYMVPSISLGHILHARTKRGIQFISPAIYIMTLSPKVNNLSGIPISRFYLVTNKI